MEFKQTVSVLEPGKVHVDITIPAAEVDSAFDYAEILVGDLEKRPLGKHQLGEDPEATRENAVATRATRRIAEQAIRQTVLDNGFRLTSNPKGDIEELAVKGEPFSFDIDLEVVPELSIGSYDDMVIEVDPIQQVSEKDIDDKLDEIAARAADVERNSNEPIKDNDVVELSFESYIDGEPYEGSVVNNYAYTIGSEYLPKAFEDGILGMVSGDTGTVEFVVPEDYGNPEIAGKTARFDVTIGRVASVNVSEIDDEFAKSFGYEGVAAWREKLREDLVREHEGEYNTRKEKALREALADLLEGEIDESMISQHAERMLQAYKTDLMQQGVDFNDYIGFMGLTEQNVRDEMKRQSAEILREDIALESLFRKEGLAIDDRELSLTMSEMALGSGMGEPPALADLNDEQNQAIREMTMHRMATEWLMDNVTFVDRAVK